MAVDTTSPLLQLLLQGTGNNNNTWGINLNNSVFLLIEQAIAGITVKNLTDAVDLTITADESRSATIVFTGEPGATKLIYMPATAKKWTIINNTTGAGQILIRVTGETVSTNVPRGVATDLISDGTTIVRKDGSKVGELFFHAGTAAPDGAIECDGAAYKRADYPELYAKIGVTWGNNDGTDFKVPNGYDTGRFVRSRTASVAVGVSQSSQNKSHTHTGSGSTGTESVGHTHSYSGTTGSQSVYHTHSYSAPTFVSYSNYSNTTQYDYGPGAGTTGTESTNHTHAYSGTTSDRSAAHTHAYSFTTSTGSEDGTESRPEAVVGIMCIRY